MSNHLVSLNSVLSHNQLSSFKIVARFALGIQEGLVKKALCFTDVYNLLEHSYTSDCPSLVVQILARLDVPERYLFSLREKARESNPDLLLCHLPFLDLILTVLYTLDVLPKHKFNSIKRIALSTFFHTHDSSLISSVNDLVELMLLNDILNLRAFDFVFAWLEVVGCSLQRQYLWRHCDTQRVNEPDWQSLVPPLKKMLEAFQDVGASLSAGGNVTVISVLSYQGKLLKAKDIIEIEDSKVNTNNKKSDTRCIGCLIFTVALFVLVNSVMAVYLSSGHYSTNQYISTNSTVLVETISDSSVSITKGNIKESYGTNVYLASDLDYITTTLLGKSWNIKGSMSTRIALNYYSNNIPHYTAGPAGQLQYHIIVYTNASSNSDNYCPLQFHLFNSVESFTSFYNNSNSLIQSISNSSCFPVHTNPQLYSIKFTLPSRGFYFVGATTKPYTFMNVTLSAKLLSFNISHLPRQYCTLDNDCRFDVSTNTFFTESSGVNLLISSSLSSFQSIHVTVSPHVSWLKLHVMLDCIGVVFIVLLVFSLACNVSRRRRRRKGTNHQDTIAL